MLKVKKVGWKLEALHIPLIAVCGSKRGEMGLQEGDILKVKVVGTTVIAKAVVVKGFKEVYKDNSDSVAINEVLANRLGIGVLPEAGFDLEIVEKEIIPRREGGGGGRNIGRFLDEV